MEARPMNPEMAARTTNLTRFAITAAVALGGARAIGCSSAPSPQEPASTPTVGTTQQPDQSREVARIQKYIDSIYTRADVRDSFLTRFYETIDCVDPNGLWSVKALLAGGGALPQTPAAHLPQRAPEVAGKPLVDSAAEYWDDVRINSGRPDANGHPRTCPVGTAPQVRLTVDRILNAGGLDSFLLAVHGKAKPPPASAPPSNDDSTGFSHAYGDYEGSNGAALPNQGGDVDVGLEPVPRDQQRVRLPRAQPRPAVGDRRGFRADGRGRVDRGPGFERQRRLGHIPLHQRDRRRVRAHRLL